MEDSSSSLSNTLKTTRLIIRVITSLVTLFYMLVFVPKLTQQLFGEAPASSSDGSWIGTLVNLSFLIFVLGFILSWKRGVTGGIMFLFAGALIFASHLISAGGEFELLPFLVFTCPMVLLGTLYILFWRNES